MIAQAIGIQPVTFSGERSLITIEFAPRIHPEENQYSYEHPRFVFGDRVTSINEDPEIEYTVCALELIESKTPSGRLLAQPRWKYKITNGEVYYWKEESAISRLESPSSNRTCSDCSYFQDYQEPEFFEFDGKTIANNNLGKGWCNCLNHQSRTHHKMTDDCILNGSLEPQPSGQTNNESLHLPNFHVGNIVKLAHSLARQRVAEVPSVVATAEGAPYGERCFAPSSCFARL